MDLGRPYAAVTPGLEGDVLDVLAGTTRPLSARRVSTLVRRGAFNGVLKALDRLVEQGIVHREEAGRAYLHTLNRDHLAARAVESLASMRAELLGRLRAELTSWNPAPVHASLFGSAARGDGGPSSDIDLFIVRPDGVADEDPGWSDQREILEARVIGWTGNRCSINDVSRSEFAALLSDPPPALQTLRRDRIELTGNSLDELSEAVP
jgi:hypothetical protein